MNRRLPGQPNHWQTGRTPCSSPQSRPWERSIPSCADKPKPEGATHHHLLLCAHCPPSPSQMWPVRSGRTTTCTRTGAACTPLMSCLIPCARTFSSILNLSVSIIESCMPWVRHMGKPAQAAQRTSLAPPALSQGTLGRSSSFVEQMTRTNTSSVGQTNLMSRRHQRATRRD